MKGERAADIARIYGVSPTRAAEWAFKVLRRTDGFDHDSYSENWRRIGPMKAARLEWKRLRMGHD